MVRTQVQLREEQAEALKKLASKRGVSLAALIRAGVDEVLESAGEVTAEERRLRAMEASGRFQSGEGDLSARHDDHLADTFGS